MSPTASQRKKQQLDKIDQALRSVWVLAIGGALVLAGFVYLLNRNTPPPLGKGAPPSQTESAQLAH